MRDAVTHSQAPFAGRYTIERELGRGGMATVYRARDLRHDRAVALKVLHPELAASMGGERFAREIRLLAGLHHPHILPLFDSGEHNGVVFYVVPCVEGESLRRRLERERQLPLEDALRITRDVADALAHAHRNGVIHRDIKPENILLEEGHAIVADFGVARALTRAAGESQTTAGMAVGTPAYMSPEQASGELELDGRSDQYSLACVLYEMLAGAPPFSGATPRATLARRFTEPPPSLRHVRDVPESTDRAIRRALAAVPADRFVDVSSFARALGIEEPTPRPTRRPLFALGIAVAIAAAGLLLSRPGRAGGDSLDPGLHALVPFVMEGATAELDGAAAARFLARALGRWSDVRLVDPMRVNDAVQRLGMPRTLRDAIAIARDLGAGRLVWGDVWSRGDSAEVRAGLYDVARGREVRTARVTMGLGVVGAGSSFDALGDSLALGSTRERSAAAGAAGTRVSGAFRRYEAGHRALAEWQLDVAERDFDDALDLDPEFALAALWSAQVAAWSGDDPADWHSSAAQAVRLAARLDSTERLRARGLLALAEDRYPAACEQYRALLTRDSLDFGAWYGLGDCQARDPVVEHDARSPSGWRFRGSWHSGLLAYARALELLPSFHRARRSAEVSALPTDLFPINPGVVRRGYALTPDTVHLAAAPGFEHDTLALVPYPIADVLSNRPGAWPATDEAAINWSRRQLLGVAQKWTRDFPASPAAHEALAAAFETLGATDEALRATAVARSRAADPVTRVRVSSTAVRLHLKRGEFDQARRVADSVLRSRRADLSISEAGYLSGLAALVGQAHLTRELLVTQAEDSTPGFFVQGEPVVVPRAIARDAYALLAYASFPVYGDSVVAIARRVRERIDREVTSTMRARVREAVLRTPVTYGYWMFERNAVFSVNSPLALHRMQRAFARGDTGAVRAIFDSAATRRTARVASRTNVPDLLYQEALMLLAIGDSARAVAQLDEALQGLAGGSMWMLEDVHRAAAIPAAMRLRAQLALARGDDSTARRWARAATVLWDGGDPAVRALLTPLRGRS